MSKKLVKKEDGCRVFARQEKQKELLVEQLHRIPIIQISCEKLNIARSTLYRWRDEDKEFDERITEALNKGRMIINDMAESKLIASIQAGNMPSVFYWLRHNHRNYRERKQKLPNDDIKPINLIIETYNPERHGNVAPKSIEVGPETDNYNEPKTKRFIHNQEETEEEYNDDDYDD